MIVIPSHEDSQLSHTQNGAAGRHRTHNLRITGALLCQIELQRHGVRDGIRTHS